MSVFLQIAHEHNADADFRRQFINVDKLTVFHREWMKAGAPKPAPWDCKVTAPYAIGIFDIKLDDSESKSNDWVWQLAMQSPECWDQLSKFVALYQRGEAKGQKASTKKRLQKVEDGVRKEIDGSATATSPEGSSSKKRPSKKQRRMPFSQGENKSSVQTSAVEMIDIPSQGKWVCFQGMHDICTDDNQRAGYEYKLDLFTKMATKEISLEEAAVDASKY